MIKWKRVDFRLVLAAALSIGFVFVLNYHAVQNDKRLERLRAAMDDCTDGGGTPQYDATAEPPVRCARH